MNYIKLIPPIDKTPIKVARVLHYLYCGGTLNRFEAASILHDTCLNSTVSNLRNDLNLLVNGQSEKVTGFQGLETICNRYWLETSTLNLDTAYKILINQFSYEPTYPPAA